MHKFQKVGRWQLGAYKITYNKTYGISYNRLSQDADLFMFLRECKSWFVKEVEDDLKRICFEANIDLSHMKEF